MLVKDNYRRLHVLLLDMYTRQKGYVTWSRAKSHTYLITNRVSQGGVLSPTLFDLYLDVLLEKLNYQGVECHVDNTFCRALGHRHRLVECKNVGCM